MVNYRYEIMALKNISNNDDLKKKYLNFYENILNTKLLRILYILLVFIVLQFSLNQKFRKIRYIFKLKGLYRKHV